MSCKPDGRIAADYEGKPNLWEFFIIYQTSTNNIKFYNSEQDKYIKMNEDGSVHCNEANAKSATVWTSPSY
jgi:hypothetical protein